MKTINKLLLIPLLVSVGVSTVSLANVSQHPSYPSSEGNYWTDSSSSDERINFSMDTDSINTDKVTQHPSYPFDDTYRWTDTTNEVSRVNFSLDSISSEDAHSDDSIVSQHPDYPFDE